MSQTARHAMRHNGLHVKRTSQALAFVQTKPPEFSHTSLKAMFMVTFILFVKAWPPSSTAVGGTVSVVLSSKRLVRLEGGQAEAQ